MQSYYKSAALLRICSFLLLLSVPHRYLAGILPPVVLPLWGICCMAVVYFLYKKRMRIEAAWIIGLFALLILPFCALGLLALIPQLFADILYLRVGFIIGLLAVTACITVTATVLFFYTERWKYFEPLVAILIFALLFFSQQRYRLTVFSNPLFAAGFTGVFMLIQIVLLCVPFLRRRRFPVFLFVFLCLAVALFAFLAQLFNKGSIENNGGLLEQKLFDFDFSQFLKLQDEVKMNTHLVMIAHVDQRYETHLFHRMHLSGWDSKKGFYEKPAPDEPDQLLKVPQHPVELPQPAFQCRETVSQEIFVVNLDPSSFIAFDYPLSVTPYTVWDTLSFKGAYKVESAVLHGVPFDLITAAPPSGNAAEGLSEEALHFYTAIDTGTRDLLLPVAEAVTGDFALYYDKIYALLDYFREGEYRYSLHPGQSPDGDQLRYFVTESKKGYCSYFAFSYCLMLRSLGIPARVAVGFFLQPESGVLNYYPVRANMAHAWVEVFFPYIGWVDLDPTTEQLAEGEVLDFSFQAGGDQFTQLLDEILLNRSSIRIRNDGTISASEARTFTQRFKRFLQMHKKTIGGLAVLFVLLAFGGVFSYPYLIIKFSQNKRKVILTLKKLHKYPSEAFYALTQKAKFAPLCTEEDVAEAKRLYRSERKLRIREHHEAHNRHKGWERMLIFLLLFLLPLYLFPDSGAENLLEKADKALQAENWDTAALLLEEGISQYPANELFQLKLGDMYFNNGLYVLAYRCFTEGLQINKYNIKLLYGAANAAAALNKDEQARHFLREYLSYNPTDIFGWSTYGWLCFKTHRTEEGIQAMLEARSNYGDDGSISNALGNLYGELFDYQNASFYYQKGIELALQHDSYYSASVYSYNKAILEAVFYRFTQAEEDARNASDYFSRASGYLMLGDLEERKNNFDRAITYYVQSTEHNHTPLPLINLAKIYLRMGHWEQAERYITQIERVTDHSWIANFGMSTTQFYSELYGLYKKLYEKKYAAEKMRISESVKDFFTRQKNLVKYSVLLRYYQASFSVYNLKLAKEYTVPDSGGNAHELYKNGFYYQAFEPVPFKALRYLRRSEALETSVIPQAQPSYIAERGMLLHDAQLLEEALQKLDPVWEKELREQSISSLIGCTKNNELKAVLYKELLQSNPACFPEYWIRLPVKLVCIGHDERVKTKIEKSFTGALKNSLFTLSSDAPFSVTAVYAANNVKLSLIGDDGIVYFRYDHPLAVTDKSSAAGCINRFAAGLFRIRL